LRCCHSSCRRKPFGTFQGFYVGVEGGVNWLVNGGYNMNTGWAAGGVVGYDFVGPRFEIEGVFRSNPGTTTSNSPSPVTSCVLTDKLICTTTAGSGSSQVSGKIEQLAFMANGYYDFMPGATIVPYIGVGAGVAFIDQSITGCSLCSTQFAYQASSAWRGTSIRMSGSTWTGATLAQPARPLHPQQRHGDGGRNLQIRPGVAFAAAGTADRDAAVLHGVLRLGPLEPVASRR
jgi:opacity protein-like surface antigen